ncbi:MAG: plasmid maintenance system killer family protein [Proteobacteria bacterium]|nr:plasmid maintenance system killer family protein [Pseudomonadota bacterium]
MIQSFSCRETEKISKRNFSRKFPPDIQERARQKLFMLNAAINLDDLKIPPSNNLESLKGDRKDQYSIRINRQWRICFEWNNGNAYNIEITDYH